MYKEYTKNIVDSVYPNCKMHTTQQSPVKWAWKIPWAQLIVGQIPVIPKRKKPFDANPNLPAIRYWKLWSYILVIYSTRIFFDVGS